MLLIPQLLKRKPRKKKKKKLKKKQKRKRKKKKLRLQKIKRKALKKSFTLINSTCQTLPRNQPNLRKKNVKNKIQMICLTVPITNSMNIFKILNYKKLKILKFQDNFSEINYAILIILISTLKTSSRISYKALMKNLLLRNSKKYQAKLQSFYSKSKERKKEMLKITVKRVKVLTLELKMLLNTNKRDPIVNLTKMMKMKIIITTRLTLMRMTSYDQKVLLKIQDQNQYLFRCIQLVSQFNMHAAIAISRICFQLQLIHIFHTLFYTLFISFLIIQQIDLTPFYYLNLINIFPKFKVFTKICTFA
ncbi:transmembrane protein, putative (macronuclear) [Tetrahymena thermophila SB210]|uniref:Transmembrane protein, putative n=1 Tax=Tetrahymena thermophila (strain SB210) TaxID=312017 RepID=W7XAV4_TETTS|nr:transmembrane protein, putative [Tetrahymena thermophila SB210]EWS76515.1 transmembrane protein, putative [Tetrahymena thermophila SB210]|eukprot:XP_012650950.1 transmembrane protein, putative [Tetrahymena thermophila SB210]